MRSARLLAAVAPPAAVTVTAVWLSTGRSFDSSALAGFRSLPSSWSETSGRLIRAIDTYIVEIGSINLAVLAVTTTVAISSIVIALRQHSSPHNRQITLCLWISGGAFIVAAMQKLILRPEQEGALLIGNSLPSGHTYAFFAFAAVVAVAAVVEANAPLRPTLEVFAGSTMAWSLLILISTGHRPSDVLVALLIGQSVTALATRQSISRFAVVTAFVWVSLTILMGAIGWTANNATGQVAAAALSIAAVLIATVGAADTLAGAIATITNATDTEPRPNAVDMMALLPESELSVNLAEIDLGDGEAAAMSSYNSMPKNSL